MKTLVIMLLVVLVCGCGLDPEIKAAIDGNNQTIAEDVVTWKMMVTANNPGTLWEDVFVEHKKSCDKCQDSK